MTKRKKEKILTCISLDGHELWAIILDNEVIEQGNSYDHGDINESVVQLLSKKHKSKIKWIKDLNLITPEHQAALRDMDSNWDTVFEELN